MAANLKRKLCFHKYSADHSRLCNEYDSAGNVLGVTYQHICLKCGYQQDIAYIPESVLQQFLNTTERFTGGL